MSIGGGCGAGTLGTASPRLGKFTALTAGGLTEDGAGGPLPRPAGAGGCVVLVAVCAVPEGGGGLK